MTENNIPDIIRQLDKAGIEHKLCNTCKKRLPLTPYYFGKKGSDPTGRDSCKICSNKAVASTTKKTVRITNLEVQLGEALVEIDALKQNTANPLTALQKELIKSMLIDMANRL